MLTEETSVEVEIWIKDGDVRKVFISGALKSLPVIFAIMVVYFLYSFGFISIGFFKGNATGIAFIILMIFVMAGAVAVLYAVGSGFQEVSELEKSSKKTRIIFRQSRIDFIKGFDCNEKSWTDFSKIKETVDGFRVYPINEKSFFINEYAFQTRQDIHNFREIARRQLGDKAKLKND